MRFCCGFVAGLLLCFLATTGNAEYYIEYDLDGTLGNGPDLVAVEVNDEFAVNIWAMGGDSINIVLWSIAFCNYDGSLELLDVDFHSPTSWTNLGPIEYGEFCRRIESNFTEVSEIMVIPGLLATLTWRAAIDQSIDDITHYGAVSGWLSTQFNDGIFGEGIGCTVMIGTTATESATWGAIKGLFR